MVAKPQLEKLYRDHLPFVWRTLRRLGVPEKDREDVAHDVFVVVHRRLDSYDASRPVRPWLFGISYRVAADHLRRAHVAREDLSESIDVANDGDDDTLLRLERAEKLKLIERALGTLDLEKRAVFVLHELEEIAAPEIASALDIPLNTVYSRLRVAKSEFARAVRKHAANREAL